MARELKVSDPEESDLNDKLKKNDARLVVHASNNLVEVYTNDWCSTYEVRLNGRKPYLSLRYRERCYR